MPKAANRATQTQRAIDVAAAHGMVRLRDLLAAGIHRETIARLVRAEKLVRLAKGLYQLPNAKLHAAHSLAETAKLVPKAVICLVSALQFHELTVMLPSQVWIAIDRTARKPRIAAPPLRVFRFTGLAYTAGVETHTIGGVAVRIYAPAKTVVDCFRYRRKIGVDIAIEAMREALKVRKCRPNDIVRYAKQCGAWTVIQPYLDALTIDGP